MHVGAFVPLGPVNSSAEFLRLVGPALEERGFESIWLAEHVVLFDQYESQYPYSPTGRFPGGGDTGLLDPLTGLAFLAAVTDELRLGTGILLVPQRNPVYTAKQVADIDHISGGRVELGIGVGWLREEFEALNVPFERRGARTDEYLGVMKALWTEDPSERPGDVYPLRQCRMFPKPAQQPHPPIHVGGESRAAMRRAARHGQGWFSFNQRPEDLEPHLKEFDEVLSEEGRSRRDLVLTVSPYFHTVDQADLERYAELGVDRLVVVVLGFDREGLLSSLDDVHTRIVEPAARL